MLFYEEALLREQRQRADRAEDVGMGFGGKDFKEWVAGLRKPKDKRRS